MVRRVVRGIGVFALGVAMLFGATVTAYADDARLVMGTTVNGVNLSNMTVPDAVSTMRSKYAAYALTVQEQGGKTETINGSDFGYSANITDEMLQAVLDQQNAGGRKAGPVNSRENTSSIAIPCTYDEGSLEAIVNGLSCITGSSVVVTSDARISDYREGQAFTIIPEIQGNNVDPAKVLQAVRDAIAGGQPTVSLDGTGCYVKVGVTKSDATLNSLLATLNQCRNMTLTYSISGNSEKLDSATILSWVKGVTADGQIDVAADSARAWIDALAAKYNTVGTTRTFHTFAGADIALSGPLGWSMDAAAETDALIAMIRTGKSQTREIARPESDWGGTYIEADLAAQHVYCFQDGQVVWDSPCVSGDVIKAGRTTPTGLFYVYSKETNRDLKGPMKDGKPEYVSHVNYWMPFSGGSGLHDAPWRGSFGGSIYKGSGSHGCLNLPAAKAAELYGIITVGYPCIVHD